jgi:hypothetical protein
MPVEIKELIVRAVVEPDRGSRRDAPSARSAQNDESEALVEACVRQVLKILERSKER